MLVREEIEIDGRKFIKHYSDQNFYIRKIKLGGDEELYTEALDLLEYERQYEETDIKIPESEPEV